MKPIVLALVLAMCADAALNHHRVTSQVLERIGTFVRDASEEVGGSVFRA